MSITQNEGPPPGGIGPNTAQLEVEKRRNIHTHLGHSFSAERLRAAIELLRDAAFRLDPQDKKVWLHVAKDGQEMLAKDLNVVLDPKTLLLEIGVGGKR